MQTMLFANELFPTLLVSPRTKKNYFGAYMRYIDPIIGNLQIEQVEIKDLVTILDQLPCQTRYVTLMVMRVLFQGAVERHIVEKNLPKEIKTPRVVVRKQKFLTWEELMQIDFGKQTKRIQFLALHGLRYGEAAALAETDIYGGVIHVRRSLAGETKTVAGCRDIPLMMPFPGFAKCQKRLATLLRPHGVTVHSLRKTYAYTLKSANVHITTAAKLMGHSDPSITMKIYTLVRDEEVVKAGQLMQNYIMRV